MVTLKHSSHEEYYQFNGYGFLSLEQQLVRITSYIDIGYIGSLGYIGYIGYIGNIGYLLP